MATVTNDELITALYCRLSVEDEKDKRVSDDESNSISNQKQILLDYCKKHGFKKTMFFVDDGISGTSFERSDFQRMQRMAEEGKICRIIVKDLSRFGREQVEAGRLTQIVYPSLGITFISIQENVNSTTGDGMEMLRFITFLMNGMLHKPLRKFVLYGSQRQNTVSVFFLQSLLDI